MHRSMTQNAVLLAVLAVLVLIVLVPFYWIAAGSIKAPQEIIARIPTLIPKSLTFVHYAKLFGASDFNTYLFNSILVSVVSAAVTVALSTAAAYAFYRLEFPGRDTLFNVILITYAFPGILVLIPLYGLMTRLGLVDNLLSLVIVNVTFAAPFSVWMMRAFFTTIPIEVEEAAIVDGASRLQTIVFIMLPLSAPGVASVAIFAFIMSWTEYLFASVLILSDAHRTIPVGFAGIIGQYQIDWGLLLAGATLATIPVVILFALIGRYFIQGLTAGAVK